MKTMSPQERAAAATNVSESAALYASRVKVYPKRITGTWRRVKWAILTVCLTVYYAGAWLRWDRGPGAPDQALLIDMSAGRAYFFDIEIWPQEVYYITGLLVLAAVGLFFVTSLFGRVWCGYACPQTVWTDLFMLVERWIQGDRSARIRLDKAPWSARKLALKLATHAVWLLIAAATGGAWVLYFDDAPTVARQFFTGESTSGVYFFVGLFTATTYLLAGWAREQVCTYMCPWPRFQAAMLDEHSAAVTYRAWRGEKRGPIRKNAEPAPGTGDCIDCKACVHVCPTGIDIRDGLQIQCIGCGLCIDACNEIMGKVDRAPNLIAWTSTAYEAERAEGKPGRYRFVRPRTILYAALLMLVATVMVVALALRTTVEVNVLRDRMPQFVLLADGSVRNGYTVKILNKARQAQTFRIQATGLTDLVMAPADGEARDGVVVVVARPDSVETVPLFLKAPRLALDSANRTVTFRVLDAQGRVVARRDAVFVGPAR
jgi:cytochrome c oxidase accessory protein FixG